MSLLEEQLGLLPPSVAASVRAARTGPDEVFAESRDGYPINGISRDGRVLFFHSRYSVAGEAERIARGVGESRCAIVLGLGMAHHVRAIARRVDSQIVLEPDPALVRSALEREDLRDLLRRGALSIVTENELADLTDLISRTYVPALHGTLTTVSLPGRYQADPARMGQTEEQLKRSVDEVKDDLAVQARFGHRWMRNALLNARRVRPRPLPDMTGESVTVCAAGPSLGDYLADEAAHAGTRFLAVDTALPIMLEHGVRPDLVVTIDCQLPTYHHFLAAHFPDIPVVADLSIPASLFADIPLSIPVLTDHPLHRLLDALGLGLPYLDVRGGNVAQAAVDLALRCGAAGITIVGADFSYPDGQTYPRGSYIHRSFEAHAGRLAPLCSHHYRFLVERPGVQRDPDEPARWLQPSLDRYARSMARYVSTLPVSVRRVRGRGASLPSVSEPVGRTAVASRATGTVREPAAVLAAVVTLINRVVTPDRLADALSRHDRDGLAARSMLPLLTHLRSRLPSATASQLTSLARDQLVHLME